MIRGVDAVNLPLCANADRGFTGVNLYEVRLMDCRTRDRQLNRDKARTCRGLFLGLHAEANITSAMR